LGCRPGGPNKADELERLAALREKGVLSEEEFTSAKTEVLGQGPSPKP
jgi:multidrug resistance efflux pump